jgi:hypothetical protein
MATKYITATEATYAKGGAGAHHRCPHCQGGLDTVRGGEVGECPWCGSDVWQAGDRVVAGRAEAGDGLTPMERRIAQQVGVTPEEVRASKQQYGAGA